MIYIILGIFDYLIDVCRDTHYLFWEWVSRKTEKIANKSYVWRKNDGCLTVEGGVKHYIKQRQIAAEVENKRRNK